MSENNISEEITLDRLHEILDKGSIVAVKVRPEGEWINDTIEDVLYDATLAITLKEEFISQDIMVDDAIECRIIRGNLVYILDGIVNDVGIIYPLKIMIKLTKIKGYGNARDSKRYTINLCGRMTYANHEKSTFATIKNISRTGISITCRQSIEIGEEIDVDIVLKTQEVLSIEGRIVRMYKVGKNFKYGIIIENLTSKSLELLNELIDDLEDKEKK